MAYPPSVFKTWIAGEILTAADLNSSFQVIPNTNIPEDIDDFSVNALEMQTQTDPGESGSESLATSLSEEIARLRFAIKDATGKTYWYQTPVSTIETVVSGTQTFAGAKTFSSAVTITPTSDQLVLGTTRTVTVTAPTPATTSRAWTIPDISGNGTFVSREAAESLTGAKTFTARTTFTGASVDIGTAGTAGALDIYPSGASSGVFALRSVTNSSGITVTLTHAAHSANTTYTIPNIGSACDFVMTAGAQTVAGAKTFSSAVTVTPTSNQLVLGVTNTTTISATAPSASRVLTIPDPGGAASFVMTEGTQTINGAKTFGNDSVFSSRVLNANGTAASPTYTFNSDADSGMYRRGADNIGWSVGGVEIMDVGASGFQIDSGQLFLPVGGVGAPALSFSVDTDTGLYRIGANNLGLSVGGSKVLDAASAGVQLLGTTTNDSASSGWVGEILSQSRLRGASTSLSTGTTANILGTALTLTAGDWEVSGAVGFAPAGTTTITRLIAGISVTSATEPASSTFAVPNSSGEYIGVQSYPSGTVPGDDIVMPIPPVRVSLSGSTTYYLIATGTFGTSTLVGYGHLKARRLR